MKRISSVREHGETGHTSMTAVSNSEAVGNIDTRGPPDVPAGGDTSDGSSPAARCGGSMIPGADAGDAARGGGDEGPELPPLAEGIPEGMHLFVSTFQTQ